MRTEKIESIQQVEESDFFVEKKPSGKRHVDDPSPPSSVWILIYLGGSIISGILAYICHYSFILSKIEPNGKAQPPLATEKLLLCLLIGIMIWFMLELILTYFSITLKKIDEKQRFLQSTLIRNGWLISLVLTLLILSFVMGSYNHGTEIIDGESARTGEEGNAELPKEETHPGESGSSSARLVETKTPFIDKLSRLLLASSMFLGIILAKTILMERINYKMLFENYEDRIQKNYEDMKMLEELNRITGKKMESDPDVESWGSLVFKTVSPEKDTVDIQTLEYFFGTDSARKIFERFDIYGDGRVTRSSFVLVYQDILNEDKRITMGMAQKVTIVEKLDIVLSCILIPFGISATIPIVESEVNFVNFIPIQFGTLLSLNAIFASILTEMFRSLVFIFLVKTFDVGDKILIDGHLHKVYDMGLLYTSFVVDKKVTVIPNAKIMDKTIVNLRKARTSLKQFKFTFLNSLEFKDKMAELNSAIEKEVASDPNVYTGKFSVYGYDLKNNSSIGINIDVVFWIQNQDIKTLKAQEDAFLIVLYGFIRDLGLVLE
ncbi:uncharacterized protein Eint_030890 [Encephalitozoon intestinalis ATCC 50506]|uniref:EF-hand domain-containing protein n=1 Tax=Encephalitozoon intestinalis (strain ATCC 50506) TaxID=876142 RepID=E0S698_ENCIT|nr:uncharacterized protein Eint_030890 [Encephalitozoon intestinalis ATCC 50506]ADM11233.1 hypothetical protein Eint_030890 [Encephalitozoon intestinalis ATCC 50506]UTX44901.1 hypothetical protein GPK93_03g04280 [Encephalitozoon intestinalis]